MKYINKKGVSKIDKQNRTTTKKAVTKRSTSSTQKTVSNKKTSNSDLSTKTTLTSKTKVAKATKKDIENKNAKIVSKTKISSKEVLSNEPILEVGKISNSKAKIPTVEIVKTKENTKVNNDSTSKAKVLTKEILTNKDKLEEDINLADKSTTSKKKIQNTTTVDIIAEEITTENNSTSKDQLTENLNISDTDNTLFIDNISDTINIEDDENIIFANTVYNLEKKFNKYNNKAKVNPANPNTVPKFVDLLPKPQIATPLKIDQSENTYNRDCYNISMEETTHKFNKFFPPTKVWGYDGMYPGPTIEAKKDTPIYVKWTNNLPDKHLLPVDLTLHGTNDNPVVRSVVHLHGANVESESDGSPDAWYTKNYSAVGPKFTKKIYKYTNHQPGTMLWYHDHTLGITRLNVYAGLAGLYIIRDSLEERLNLPSDDYEYPIMIQDKSFNDDGSLFYPDGPTPPAAVTPSIAGGFFGDTIVVNGKTWPYLNVEPRKYRFRIINTCNARPLTLNLSNDGDFYQIGTDGGLIHHTAILKNFSLEPAERIDVIVDFSKSYGKTIDLLNTGFNADRHTGVIMRFKVCTPLKGPDRSTIPSMLSTSVHVDENLAAQTRNLSLSQSTDEFGRPLMLLDNKMWSDPTTETPKLDSIEVWNLINTFPFPHPIHVHLVQFMILDRTPYDVELYQQTGEIKFTGPPEEPHPYEMGFKDTCSAEGGKVTRIAMQFTNFSGEFAWHCHVLEHEDHDMMRPLRVLKNNC